MARVSTADIYDKLGRRKYLTQQERRRFRQHVGKLPHDRQAFCLMLYYTGCRISEALELPRERIDLEAGIVVFRTLKQKRNDVYRIVPLPPEYINFLESRIRHPDPYSRIWPFCRKTGYRAVKQVMAMAGIKGIHASPKGLRHGFGVDCVLENVPLTNIREMMGHRDVETTAIYTNVIGKELRKLVSRTWK